MPSKAKADEKIVELEKIYRDYLRKLKEIEDKQRHIIADFVAELKRRKLLMLKKQLDLE